LTTIALRVDASSPDIAPSTLAPVEEYAVNRYARSHVSNDALHRSAVAHAVKEREATADLLADLAEIDARKFYLAMAYPSLFAYCVAELRLSEDAAFKRIKAARAARRFPVVFEVVADGRLNLSGVVLLAPLLTEDTAPGLLAAAENKTKLEIEKLVAEHSPRPDVLAWIAPIPEPVGSCAAPAPMADPHAQSPSEAALPLCTPVTLQAPGPVDSTIRSIVKPSAPHRYEVHFSMSDSAHDKLRYLQCLLGFETPSGDLGQIFEDALDARIREVEKQKFTATDHPRRSRGSSNPRHIPSDVKRAVWKRDGAQCTFVSDDGRRCQERRGLQFDHVLEVARGGEATTEGIQLRCWAHNQYGAERTFGSEFMRHKRTAAVEARAAAKARSAPAVERPMGSGPETGPERAAS
jgi:5-methylcytosine-specific restriction endonuclease McrA